MFLVKAPHNIKFLFTLSGVLSVLLILAAVHAEEELGEDPFLLELKKQEGQQEGQKPWLNRSPEEIRKWIRENAHVKLRANNVIDAEAHPEWEWFRKSGLGLFIHWGLTSANENTGDAWAMVWNERKIQANRYKELPEEMFKVAKAWNPDAYDPGKWLAAAKKAGFGYSVLTTRHHDGYALWPSEHGTWDTGDHMDGRDLVKDYIDASRANDMKIGLYFSGPNWHYDYKNRSFTLKSTKYQINYKHEKLDKGEELTSLMGVSGPEEKAETQAQVRELMKNYGKIDIMWWDGAVPMAESELRPMQPDILIARGNIATPEGAHQSASQNVKAVNEAGWWWEACQKAENTYTSNWHYGVESETNHWDANTLLTELIRCRSLGGNLLVNVPPRGNGEMMDWFYDLCNDMSEWMSHSREAVYDVDQDAPLPMLDKTENFTTKRGNTYYSLPDQQGRIFISKVEEPKAVTLLSTGEEVSYEYKQNAIRIVLPKGMQTSLPDLVKIVF